jgi:hypothetical protein
LPWLPWNIKNPNPQFSKAHLTDLNLNNFKMVEAMRLKNYLVEVPLNRVNSVSNIVKIYQVVEKLLVGDRETDRVVI